MCYGFWTGSQHVMYFIFRGIPGHRCASLGIASLRIFPGIAGHLSFLHSFVWLGIAGHRRELLAVPGHRFFYRIILCFILVSLSLLASPGIAGIAAYLSWHRWASFVPLASLRIAGHGIAAYLSWHCWASFVSSQLRMAGHRRSSPGSAGLLCISFFCSVLYRFSFLLYYLSWHRRALRASLRISPGIAGHLSWYPWALTGYRWISQSIAGHGRALPGIFG